MSKSYPYFDRDISWLSFNHRVLEEAKDIELPLYERIKFLAIYSSNLDEFYRVRVADLRRLKNIKKKIKKKLQINPEEVLNQINNIVSYQQEEFGNLLRNQIMPALKVKGIYLYQQEPILKEHEAEITHYFRSKVMSYLQPVILSGEKGKMPFLENRLLYFIIYLKAKGTDETMHAQLNIPSNFLSRFLMLSEKGGKIFIIMLDDIIKKNLPLVFPGYEIKECYSIKINRDADLNIEDEYSGNLVEKIKKQLKKRDIGAPTRLLYDQQMPADMLTFLKNAFKLEEDDLVAGGNYHNLNDLMNLPNPYHPDLQNHQFFPVRKKELEETISIFDAIETKDFMFHFPYHSYDYVLRFFNEAAIDPFVKEINTAFYRVANDSLIVNALISAAKNGKKVNVFVEVKARFDEENNLQWSEKMKEAGIKIFYSMPGLKVHAKIALVVRKTPDGKKHHYGFFGTGNFNEKTARIYADHGLLTSHPQMTKELLQVFKLLNKKKNLEKLNHLLVTKNNLREMFIEKIDREIKIAQKGEKGYLVIKVNNLEDHTMIDKLYDASQQGVKVDLIVRGICCLVPGIQGLSDNIRVIRIVDQFLEHARVFIFHNQGNEEIYMASADWMKRNLYHRIEVGFPVYDPEIKDEIKELISFQLNDNTKARIIDREMNNLIPDDHNNQPKIRSQVDFYNWIKMKEEKQKK